MFISSTRLIFLSGVIILISSCTSSYTEPKFNEKSISSVESKNGNVVFHMRDNATQSFSMNQVGALMNDKKITEETYLLCLQKVEEEKLTAEQYNKAK